MSDHENVEIQKTDKASAIEQQQCFPSIPYVEWGFNSGLNNIMNMLRRGIVIRDPESISSVNKLGMVYEGIPFDKGKRKLCDDSYLEQLPYPLSKTQHQSQCVLASTPRPPIAINHVSCSSGPPSCVPAAYSSGLASTRSFEKFVGCSTHTINRFTKGYTAENGRNRELQFLGGGLDPRYFILLQALSMIVQLFAHSLVRLMCNVNML